MAKRGISLKFDEEGNAETVAPIDGEMCSEFLICNQCRNNMCHAVKPPKHIYDKEFKRCPAKKWVTLSYPGMPECPIEVRAISMTYK